MKRVRQALQTSVLSCLISLGFADSSQQVNFLNWALWIDPSVVSNFEASTGITVNQTYFSDEDMLKARLLQRNNGLDLVVPTLRDMQIEIQAGLFQPLDKSKIKHYNSINKTLLKKAAQFDPGNKYGIIYDWASMGIGYNEDMVKKILGPNVKIDDWKYALDPQYLSKLQQCGVSFYDTSLVIFAITLDYLGLNPNSTNIADYQTATDYLLKIRPYLTYFSNSNYIFDLASGNLCLVIGDSGDILRAQKFAEAAGNHVHIKYVIPKSGAPLEIDMLAIPKDAPHVEATYAFINALMDPKNAAATSNYIFIPNQIPASTPYLNPILRTPTATPTDEMIEKDFYLVGTPPPAVNQAVTDMWLEVRYDIKEQNQNG